MHNPLKPLAVNKTVLMICTIEIVFLRFRFKAHALGITLLKHYQKYYLLDIHGIGTHKNTKTLRYPATSKLRHKQGTNMKSSEQICFTFLMTSK